MATKKYFTDESLSALVDEIKAGDAESLSSAKSYTDTEVAKKADSSHTHDDRYYTESEIDTKLAGVNSTISTHTGNTTVHITSDERTNWNTAHSHSTSAHAPSNAEKNIIVGIQKNGTDLTVDASTRKVNITVPTTAADIGAATSTHNHDDKYDAKGSADTALASAKTYADSAATKVKNDLLNGAGAAYDTLKELGELIVDNADAIEALETIASGKADATHTHAIADVSGLQSALDGKAAASHGTHVTFDSTNKPKMDGTAAFGTSTSVARADHVHPTDTSRAAKSDLDALEAVVSGKADSSHTHNYAGSSSAGGAATSANKVNSSLTVKLNGGTTEGTNMFTFNGSAAKSINITPSAIGAAASSHTHDDRYYTETEVDEKLASKAASSHTHSDATTSAAGFMTADMVTKLNGIAAGATKVTVDSSLSTSSTNPVRNSAVTTAINSATSAISANTSSISSHSQSIAALQTAVADIQEITSEEIQSLFSN